MKDEVARSAGTQIIFLDEESKFSSPKKESNKNNTPTDGVEEEAEPPPEVSKAYGPPQDGRAAWLQVLMGHIIIFNTWGYINSYGVFQTYYVAHLGHPASDISWVGSVQVFMLFFIGTFSGRATDAGYFRPVFITGLLAQLLGVFMTSISSRYYQLFLTQGILTGIGNGLLFCPSLAVISTYHNKRKALALGIVAAGTGTGGLVFPAIAQQLLPRLGFGWTLRVMGFVMLGTMSLPLAFTRARLPPRRTGPIIDWHAFREMGFLLYTIGITLIFWGIYFAFYYIGEYGVNKLGMSENGSISLLLVLNGCGILGRVIPSYISDKWLGPINTMIPFALISSLMMYTWIAVSSVPGIIAFAVFYGTFSSGMLSLFVPVLASLTPELNKTGVRLGMLMSCISVACLTGPPIGGAVIQRQNGQYIAAQAFFGSVIALGLCFLFAVRFVKTGMKIVVRA